MTRPITLYTFGTPNGYKISIFLELLQLPYEVVSLNIHKNKTKEEWFVKLNPNGRIPTITDPNFKEGPITISQTGAILQYLADQYDTDHKYSYPQGTAEYYKTLEYLIFQVAENGPIQGQLNHFKLYAPEKVPYGITRYENDTKRIYGVYEDILSRNSANGNKYLVGDRYTVADIALFGWANSLFKVDIDINQWPLLGKWFSAIKELPGVEKGLTIPPRP
ncbi:Glutathione S-transferase-like protein tpcF [Candida viswanathii]|uniref:Glutathione S-transferase-like protein tpcF n=1 Tax=Candida viswanathii TaxID=5486 RepID=A0A367Y1N5_9ASCO|nr:Glutathione S-transferase-like protein tpcF [Candida viswanathii]